MHSQDVCGVGEEGPDQGGVERCKLLHVCLRHSEQIFRDLKSVSQNAEYSLAHPRLTRHNLLAYKESGRVEVVLKLSDRVCIMLAVYFNFNARRTKQPHHI